jgi:hypothetical protein
MDRGGTFYWGGGNFPRVIIHSLIIGVRERRASFLHGMLKAISSDRAAANTVTGIGVADGSEIGGILSGGWHFT